jgi:phage terminase small subunit
LDEYGSRVWDRLVDELEPQGILNPSQRELLAAYCQIASVNVAAWKELSPNRERGPDILVAGRDDRDSQVRSKAWGILRESAALLDKLSRSLLTSPAALMRAELPAFEDDDESDLD